MEHEAMAAAHVKASPAAIAGMALLSIALFAVGIAFAMVFAPHHEAARTNLEKVCLIVTVNYSR